MKKVLSIFLFILTGLTILAGIGNLVIRNFYGYKPEIGFVLRILVISDLLTWAGVYFWRKK
jgi:hypothetical protein